MDRRAFLRKVPLVVGLAAAGGGGGHADGTLDPPSTQAGRSGRNAGQAHGPHELGACARTRENVI